LSECHIACWREAYRGIVPDHVLDAFDVERRTQAWERIRATGVGTIRIALVGDEVVGFAGSGPGADPDPPTPLELNALYIRSSFYGTGVADDLIEAVIGPSAPCSLWVFEANPR